jgi:predicted DNA-binding transcriptional regulator
MKKWKKRQQAVDDKVNSLEMNGRKNKIVIFRILVSKGGGGVDEIYVDMDIVAKFWNEANE